MGSEYVVDALRTSFGVFGGMLAGIRAPRCGLATLCIGGGESVAEIFERVWG